MKRAVVFEAHRTGYNIEQVADRAMTVGELISLLGDYDEDTVFVLSHDNGYTYGSINSFEMVECTENEDGKFEEDF